MNYDTWYRLAAEQAQEQLPGCDISSISEDGRVYLYPTTIHTEPGFVTPFKKE